MKAPKVWIPRKLYQQIMHWVNKSTYEVSWFGTLDYNKQENEFILLKLFMAKQENSSASTEQLANSICELLYDTRNEPGDLRYWMHSHVDMSVFWSSTDLEAMKKLSKNGWFLSTVFNKKYEMRTAFAQDGEISIFMDNIQTHIWDPILTSDVAEWNKIYEENVKIEKPTYRKKHKNFMRLENLVNGKIPQDEWEEFFLGKDSGKEIDDDEIDDDDIRKAIKQYNSFIGSNEEEQKKLQSPDEFEKDFEKYMVGKQNKLGDKLIMQQILDAKEKRKASLFSKDDGFFDFSDSEDRQMLSNIEDSEEDKNYSEFKKKVMKNNNQNKQFNSDMNEKRILPLKKQPSLKNKSIGNK